MPYAHDAATGGLVSPLQNIGQINRVNEHDRRYPPPYAGGISIPDNQAGASSTDEQPPSLLFQNTPLS